MSPSTNSRSALEAVLAASRSSGVRRDKATPIGLREAPKPPERQALAAVDPAAASLLGRLLAFQPLQGGSIFQFAACAAGDAAAEMAAALAHAAAVLVGRTLLIRADAPLAGRFHPATQPNRPLSDAFLPGLYHYRVDAGIASGAMLCGSAPPPGLTSIASQYRVVVVDSTDCVAALALAPFCTGTILVVWAGITPVTAVRSTALRIVASGGCILGAVLVGVGAPAVRP